MSDSNKSEQPTEHKLREARARGSIPRSADATTNLTLLGWCLVWSAGGAVLFDALLALMRHVTGMDLSQSWDALRVRYLPFQAALLLAGLASPVAVGIVLALAADQAQTRFLVAGKRPWLSFEQLNPVNGFKRLFGFRQLGIIPLAVARFTVLAVIVWWSVRPLLASLDALWQAPLLMQLGLLGRQLLKTILFMGMAMLPLSLLDWMWQRHAWRRDNRMSKDDVRREFKNQEGDPQMKGRRKQIHIDSVR